MGDKMGLERFLLFASAGIVAACGTADESATTGSQSAADQLAAGVPSNRVESEQIPGSSNDFIATAADRVFFAVDRYDLTSAARTTLERQAQWLQRYPSRRVVVQGHADERGTREYNLALGDRRANAVRNFLVAMGIDSNRITTVSFGKEQPAELGATETAWAQNRRGVTIVD